MVYDMSKFLMLGTEKKKVQYPLYGSMTLK